MQGQISLVDSEIVFEPNPTTATNKRVAIRSNRSLYLNNVFVWGATKVVVTPDGGSVLPANPIGWIRVSEFAQGAKPASKGEPYRYPLYLDGVRQETPVTSIIKDEPPPANLQSRHLWARDFPSSDMPGAANVKAPPYNARGDGKTDDTKAIQQAVNERDVIFLPKGYYRVSRTINLRPQTKFAGVGQHLSILVPTAAEGDFADPAKPAPLIRTADEAQAETVLAFCGLWAPNHLPVFALHWRCGGHSIFRAVEISHGSMGVSRGQGTRLPPTPREHPLVLVTGHGGGNWYNFREGGEYAQAPGFREILIEGTASPLNFYQLSPQHVSSDYAVEMRNARNVSVFGTKYEGSSPMFRVADSAQIRLFGHGGNGKPVAGGTLFQFVRSQDFLVANAVEGPTKIGTKGLSHRLGSTDPRLWHMILDQPDRGVESKTTPLDRPVLYRRGAPSQTPNSGNQL